jgi:HAD superfamily hydrolase (TIGR01458 family)
MVVSARVVLLDIDGVLTVSWEPVEGAVEAVRALRDAGVPFALLTNTTSRTRASMASALTDAGFPVTAEDILTAPAVAAAYLREHHPDAGCLLLNSGDIVEDLTGVRLVDEHPDAVLLGGAGPEFDYATLNAVFGHLRDGARLLTMSTNLYWRTDDGLRLDTGFFLPGLERAAGVTATVVGKPSEEFFATALGRVDAEATDAVMVGDDVRSDVLGAQEHGITGVLVRTGKYERGDEDGVDGERPDHVIDSVADLPELLGLG